MGNKLIFLVQTIQGCRDLEMFCNGRCGKTGVLSKRPQSLAGIYGVILVSAEFLIFLHVRNYAHLRFKTGIAIVRPPCRRGNDIFTTEIFSEPIANYDQ